ncbi:MAG: hypothetical protein ABH881_04250 [bacterium]
MLKRIWMKISMIAIFVCLCFCVFISFFNSEDKEKLIQNKNPQKISNENVLNKTDFKTTIAKNKVAKVNKKINKTKNRVVVEHQQAENKNNNSIDDYAEILSGSVNEDNYIYRSDYYSKLDYEIAKEHMYLGDNDPVENIVEQFETSIDYNLGIDFTEGKRKKMREAQRGMLYKKELLDNSDEQINDQEYIDKIVSYHNKYLEEMSEILDDEEFEILFQISKDEMQEALLLVIDVADS